ncbi:MAG: bifunctional rhamnulose-1-phosphate aldolase/short-chain dehydrogenase [Candidatus Omnitrophica bacterium]|nr:bifunctional rhamnulose-1-phosphate aldolase/short-chain dehydrogenase [Candidatus Omnitrophota bacterium]
MRSRWNIRQTPADPLEALAYRSRLIGDEETLGLFGGGNTSTKATCPDLFGHPEPVLWVKGSGADLKGCEPRHFAALRLAPLRALARRAAMSDEAMVDVLERCLIHPKSPRPSVETLLHAFIPEHDIDHTHADAILALANTDRGAPLVRTVLGDRLIWIPYLQPGFALSKRVFDAYQRSPGSHGAVLEQHGLITWGSDGQTSYRRTVHYVTLAERYLARQRRRRRWSASRDTTLPDGRRMAWLRQWLPAIRRTISQSKRMCLTYDDSPEVLEFVNASRMPQLASIGPATPDHMLRTKRLPLIVQNREDVVAQLARYAASHARYFQRYHHQDQTMLDPYPRVILVPRVGMLTTGKDATETAMVATIYKHAMAIIRNASSVGRYTSVSEREAFGVEYWPLELYKLSLAPAEAELSRLVGLVTGAVGGIGRGIAQMLVDRGASVVVTDLQPEAVVALAQEINQRAGRRSPPPAGSRLPPRKVEVAGRALGVVMDVTQEESVERAMDETIRAFGGIDFLVSNAGIATVSSIDRLSREAWERSLAVNATGHFLVARSVVRWLRAQGLGGALVFIASKNVPAPGKEFGAYSAAKAAETQLARILAIENGEHGVRVNIVHPDGVFDGSGLWKTIGPDRAKTYRLPPDQLEAYYQQRNLLKARVTPSDVAEAVCFLLSQRSAKTTGCVLTVDGGLREAFPR